ncbi:MAG: hypothetical protein KA436_06930 [Oligoflexales bacterium]|nr:hypothetical protein [Oligoflexales bacterium]
MLSSYCVKNKDSLIFRPAVLWLMTLISLCLSAQLQAREYKWTHFGVRPLAMGNAFVAVVDDQNALFYNPAGLARLQTWDFEILNPTFEVSTRTLGLYKDIINLNKKDTSTSTSTTSSSSTSSSGNSDIDSILDVFQHETGRTHSFGLKLNPHFITSNWGFGVGMDNSFSLVFHEQIEMDVQLGSTTIAPFGIGFNFLENRLSLGAALKYVYAMGIDQTFGIDSMAKASKELTDYIQTGRGMGLDLGLLFTPFDVMQPTLGISLTDAGGTRLDKFPPPGAKAGASSAQLPPRLPSLNVGLSIKPVKTDWLYLLLAMDSQMINQPIHFSHKLSLGAELGLGSLLKLQAGVHEGDISGGFQFDVGLVNIRFASYSVDHGPVVGLDKELKDRRYALQLKILI